MMHGHFTPIDIDHIYRKAAHKFHSKIVLSAMSVFTMGIFALLFYTLAEKYHVL